MNDRSADQIICNGQNGLTYTFTPSAQIGGICDGRILLATDNNQKQTLFFKGTVSFCPFNMDDCNQITDGRGLNDQQPYLTIAGQTYGCTNSDQFRKIIVYPASGQTVQELHNTLVNLIGADC